MEKWEQLSSKYHKCFPVAGMDEPSLARWHFVNAPWCLSCLWDAWANAKQRLGINSSTLLNYVFLMKTQVGSGQRTNLGIMC